MFCWMFIEGLYLCLIVYFTYRAEKGSFWPYALVGWGLSGLLTLIRVVVDSANHPFDVWIYYPTDKYFLVIPALILLGLNVILLLAILYAINEKLRRSINSQSIRSITATTANRFNYYLANQFPSQLNSGGQRMSNVIQIEEPTHNIRRSNTTRENNGGSLASPRSNSFRMNKPRLSRVQLSRQSLTKTSDTSGTNQTSQTIPSEAEKLCFKPVRSSNNESIKPVNETVLNGISEFNPSIQDESRNCSARSSQMSEIYRLEWSGGTRGRLSSLIGRINRQEFLKTIKASLTLMPLLGLPNVIFITPYHPSLKPAFDMISAFLLSTQGIWVSLLYCFLTKDVRQQFRKRLNTWSIRSSLYSQRRSSRSIKAKSTQR